MSDRPVILIKMLCLAMSVCLLSLSAVTADDGDTLDRELLDALEGKPSANSRQNIVRRLIDGTKTVSQRLSQGQLDEETAAIQTRILADIDALLDQSSPPRRPPQNQSSSDAQSQQDQKSSGDQQSQDGQQDQSQEDKDSQQDGQSDPNAASEESAERTTRGDAGDGERERRLGLSTAAWGHLPPKVREQMRSAFSEEYLPEYDALVRRYYEALARRRSADGDHRDGD